MTAEQAATMTNILRTYQHRWSEGFKYDTAGKSGTTDNFVDAWYMDFTPDWVVATWAGHTSETDPAEVGMSPGVFGTDEGKAIAVPFVNSLGKPSAWPTVSGILQDCQSGEKIGSTDTCPTPTPAPTPVPTDTPVATPASPTPCETVLATPSPSALPTFC